MKALRSSPLRFLAPASALHKGSLLCWPWSLLAAAPAAGHRQPWAANERARPAAASRESSFFMNAPPMVDSDGPAGRAAMPCRAPSITPGWCAAMTGRPVESAPLCSLSNRNCSRRWPAAGKNFSPGAGARACLENPSSPPMATWPARPPCSWPNRSRPIRVRWVNNCKPLLATPRFSSGWTPSRSPAPAFEHSPETGCQAAGGARGAHAGRPVRLSGPTR